MEPLNKSKGPTPFTDLSNTSNADQPNDAQPNIINPKERRRQRDRERYVQMSDQQRAERNKKRLDAYHIKKKAQSTVPTAAKDDNTTVNREDMYAAESRDWLCMNDSMQEVEQESIIIQHLPCTVICYELVSF